MSDRAAWLERWCPQCQASPGARCRQWRWGRRTVPVAHLHTARGWLERRCPTCAAPAGARCSTPSGREASQPHATRLRPARHELVRRAGVWEELERRGATVATVPFWGRAGSGGRTDTITLLRSEREELIEIELWTSRDELSYALEAPVWDRFGTFAGHPHIAGEVLWFADDRRVLIRGRRGDTSFEELAA